MTTIDHAPSLAVSGSGALTDDRVARRALQVARRTALGVLGDTETAADVAQDVAITRWALHPSRHPRWAPGVVDEEVTPSAVILLSVGNLTSGQRAALFQLLARRPGARSLGQVTDAIGRRGVGVELGGLRVIIDPETSDILQTSEVSGPPPILPPTPPPGVRKPRGLRPCGQSSTPRSS
jgi:hypothetical protein